MEGHPRQRPGRIRRTGSELIRESMTMTVNWLGITAASKVALEMTEE